MRAPLPLLLLSAAAVFVGVACGDERSGDDEALSAGEAALQQVDGGYVCPSPEKVLICHVPPGNPANAHTLCVGAPAQKAHEGHGDPLGACGTSDGGTPPTSGDPVDAGSAGGEGEIPRIP